MLERLRGLPACSAEPRSDKPVATRTTEAGLRRGMGILDRDERREYEWVRSTADGNPDAPHVNFIQFRIVKNGKVTYQNAWVTDLVPDTDNIVGLVRAARARSYRKI